MYLPHIDLTKAQIEEVPILDYDDPRVKKARQYDTTSKEFFRWKTPKGQWLMYNEGVELKIKDAYYSVFVINEVEEDKPVPSGFGAVIAASKENEAYWKAKEASKPKKKQGPKKTVGKKEKKRKRKQTRRR